MAALSPQSGIARELETESERERERETKLKFAFFCRHFRFCFFSSLCTLLTIFIMFCILFCSLGHFIIIFLSLLFCVCQFLRRLAMFKRHPHPQCLPVSVSSSSLSVLAIALASQNCWSWITKVNWADTDIDTRWGYSGVCASWYTHYHFLYGVISFWVPLCFILSIFFWVFPFSIFS